MEKRRKIFEGDGTTVEEVISTKPRKKPDLSVNAVAARNDTKDIHVDDVLDSFAGYLPASANFMPKDSGKCVICGKDTSSSMRKLCFDCLQNHAEELYEKALKAIDNGDKVFQI